jgi:hypothetical protein
MGSDEKDAKREGDSTLILKNPSIVIVVLLVKQPDNYAFSGQASS